jgi:hypothetical protein
MGSHRKSRQMRFENVYRKGNEKDLFRAVLVFSHEAERASIEGYSSFSIKTKSCCKNEALFRVKKKKQ